jgi:hypothetical protein
MANRIWSVEDLDRERRRCAEAECPFYPHIDTGGTAAAHVVAELYRVTGSTPPENIHDAPVTVGDLVDQLRRWESAARQFEGRNSWLVIKQDIDEDGPPEKELPPLETRCGGGRTESDGPLHRCRLGLAWHLRETSSPIHSGWVRDEVVAVLLTRGEDSSVVSGVFMELANDSGRVLQALLPPSDRDRRLRPTAHWSGFLFELLRPRGGVRTCKGFLLIDRPFAAAAMVLRRSLFGQWSDVGDWTGTDPSRSDEEQGATSYNAKRPTTKGKNIDGKIRRKLNDDERAYGWSAAEWATFCKCSAGTVKGTPVWKNVIMKSRDLFKAARKVQQAKKRGRTNDD